MNKKNNTTSSIFSTDLIVMGILNLTNDSFYDGGKYIHKNEILKQTEKMIKEGALIIDIGAQSSKPGSRIISSKDELKKLLPTIKLIKKEFPDTLISVDTFWSKTAKASVSDGADIINDISAGEIDKKMFDTIAKLKIPYVLMHMKGIPENMQKHIKYNNIVKEVYNFFKDKIQDLNSKGFFDIVIDPGFGFGKSIENNFELLKNLEKLNDLNCPILVGTSRKSMIQKTLNVSVQNALNGTTITNTIALLKGASILRVHDVNEAIECIKIYEKIK